MIRTREDQQDIKTPKNPVSSRQTGALYTLNTRGLLHFANQKSYERRRGYIEAQVTNASIEIRVDWDGDETNLGRFEVQAESGDWQSCKLIDPDEPNDIVAADIEGDVLLARFHRNPDHGHAAFGIRLIPIVWLNKPAGTPDPDYAAQRGTDYIYRDGITPETIPWTYSVLADGVHRLTLELKTDCDYEVWTRIQDPADPDHWRYQDPIFSSSPGGGNNNPNNDNQ